MNADAIVKALRCCNVPSGRACSECPYHEVGAECRTQRNKDAASLIEEMSNAYHDLEYILMGVMHFVDKWLDDDELNMNEVNRAMRMREKTLQIVEELAEENGELKSDLKYAEEEYDRVYEQAEADIRGNIADGGTSCHWCIAGHRAETVQKMQKKLEERIDQTIQVFDFQISECNAVRQALRGVKNDINQIVKEVLED